MKEDKLKKGKTRRRIYQYIVKENKSYQEAFELLKGKTKMGNQVLAETISKTPNKTMTNKIKSLIYTYVAILGLIIISRILGIVFLFGDEFNALLLLTFVILGILVPVLGIYSALTHRVEGYRTIAILLAIGAIRSFKNADVDPSDPVFIAALLIQLLAVGLALYIPTKFKVPFNKKVLKEEIDGKKKVRTEYNFEEVQRPKSEELLDT